ncbi:ATP-dependent DNA ligase [Planctomonas sp. JC2975]|uniref:DUF7882 family protein n=1 Tax=Planctomonas sp. JC2975 TaxID=2729626 RepID=UPI001473466C|nr:ATP-dependent DNA ligase [Planctomonas sp. JC2975]NNC13726.1 ATP-dependent DNA ligase [Planctomonas sp. JC2975]
MGLLLHAHFRLEMDDELLGHLETVVVNKFRRSESFLLTWLDGEGAARRSLWMSCKVPAYFQYQNGHPRSLDREWLLRLQIAADGSRGLFVTREDGTPARVRIQG